MVHMNIQMCFYYLPAFATAFAARPWRTPFAELSRGFRAWRFCFRGGFPTWTRILNPFMEVFDAAQLFPTNSEQTCANFSHWTEKPLRNGRNDQDLPRGASKGSISFERERWNFVQAPAHAADWSSLWYKKEQTNVQNVQTRVTTKGGRAIARFGLFQVHKSLQGEEMQPHIQLGPPKLAFSEPGMEACQHPGSNIE